MSMMYHYQTDCNFSTHHPLTFVGIHEPAIASATGEFRSDGFWFPKLYRHHPSRLHILKLLRPPVECELEHPFMNDPLHFDINQGCLVRDQEL
jgi:hypothetical protein